MSQVLLKSESFGSKLKIHKRYKKMQT